MVTGKGPDDETAPGKGSINGRGQGSSVAKAFGAPEQGVDAAGSPARTPDTGVHREGLSTGQDEAEREDEYADYTPEQLQDIREHYYRTFCGEDKTDYTRGPSRVVLTTDGVEDCTALLLTLELSQAVQRSVHAQRKYKKAGYIAAKKIAAFGRFKHTMSSQRRTHKARLISPTDSNEDQAKKEKLEGEISGLELMLERYQLERIAVENDLTFRSDQLRSVQTKLNALLEDSWDRLGSDQAALDNRDQARDQAENERYAALDRDDEHEDATSGAFDVRWHAHERGPTHELIEAEKAYDEAQRAAADFEAESCDALSNHDSDEEADWETDAEKEGDGNVSSSDEALARQPFTSIWGWFENVSSLEVMLPLHSDNDSELDEVDEWEAEELGFGESLSLIFEQQEMIRKNWMKAKIDESARMKKYMREEFAETVI